MKQEKKNGLTLSQKQISLLAVKELLLINDVWIRVMNKEMKEKVQKQLLTLLSALDLSYTFSNGTTTIGHGGFIRVVDVLPYSIKDGYRVKVFIL